ncbi:MAG: PHB depolymerase family esterase [Fimbriimonadaceae bacterium]
MTVPLLLVLLAGPQVEKIDVAGLERSYLVFAPNTQTKAPPLVFGFHGHGGNMRQASRSFRMHEEMPEAVVVYMDGLPTAGKTDPEGKKQGWQQNSGTYDDRDLRFFDAVYSAVTKKYGIDASKVYSMGHSNGGRFTYLLWKERADKFAAFGPSGSPSFLEELAPKPVFHVAGEKDPVVAFLGQRLSVQRQMRTNGCDSTPSSVDGYVKTYKGKDGADVAAYFHPGGHEFPRDVPGLLAEFFRAH